MPATHEAKSPASPTAKANITIATAFWLACLLVALFCASKGQKVEAERTTPSGFVESPRITLARTNMTRFKQQAPHQEFVLRLMPAGGKRPTEMTVVLGREWKTQSPQTQKELMATWSQLWSQTAQPASPSESKPRLHFHPTNRPVRSWGG
ncbi:hypothetical protein EON83_29360 [bacterium]|nr:MAG: hypothetical protein EON83_29360 [bacterium]